MKIEFWSVNFNFRLLRFVSTVISMLLVLFVFYSCQKQHEANTIEVKNLKPLTDSSEEKQSDIPARIIDYDTLVWKEILEKETVQLDIRYATTNNFTKEVIYDCGRCFLRKASAQTFYKIIEELKQSGYGVKLFDCYRPRPAQYKLWEIVPNPMYVADPKKGSMHNRGLAMDLTLTDLQGKELDMGTAFDFFGRRAYHDFVDLPKEILDRRTLLKETMAKYGFGHVRTEWWHYSDATHKGNIADFQWNCSE